MSHKRVVATQVATLIITILVPNLVLDATRTKRTSATNIIVGAIAKSAVEVTKEAVVVIGKFLQQQG